MSGYERFKKIPLSPLINPRDKLIINKLRGFSISPLPKIRPKSLRAFDASMKRLGLDHLDLYLLHKPYGNYYAAWRVLERLYKEGRIRAIIPYIVDALFYDYPFRYSLGFVPFILVKKRVNEAVSEKCRRTAISAMGSDVCCNR